MIHRINNIKNFGIFKDFKWASVAGIPDFKDKNIIYGWNYSGKTTLSRIFSSLRDKSIHAKYKNSEFRLNISADSKKFDVLHDELDKFSYGVRVFNSEYVRDNLRWDINVSLDAISFDVGENVQIRGEIERNELMLEKIEGTADEMGRIRQFESIINEFNQFDSWKFTEESRKIKNNIFNSLIEFNKSHFKNIKQTLGNNLNLHLVLDEQEFLRIKNHSVAKNDKGKIFVNVFIPNIINIYNKVSEILRFQPAKSEVIDLLNDNAPLHEWVKEGFRLHTLHGFEECSFCGNSFTTKRAEVLNNYFSNASARLRLEIIACRKVINDEVAALEQVVLPKSKHDFSDTYQQQYESQLNLFNEVKSFYNNALHELLGELDRKENGNLFNCLVPIEWNPSPAEKLNSWFECVRLIIDKHNSFINNFISEQEMCRSNLKKHLIADFLIAENFHAKEQAKINADRCIRRYNILAERIKERNNILLAKLKSVVAGQAKLNEFIKAFLNRDDITIEVSTDDKFLLRRGLAYADNLSEGEKTAISFAYFLVSLESLHTEKKLCDTIIFIDDPISSLDANHIAQIYSLINSFFFRKGEDPLKPEEWSNCFKQLFISTHNFEFFSFLKDSTRLKSGKGPTGCEFYFVRRTSNNSSELAPLPKSLKLKSEYIYIYLKYYLSSIKMAVE